MKRIVQPTLLADTKTLFKLYSENMAVTAKQISQAFNVCKSTSYDVIHFVHQYSADRGYDISKISRQARHLAPTDTLFERYGWDINDIRKRVKMQS